MSRLSLVAESQTAQLAGVNSGTTVNGYVGAAVAGASANFRLRRLLIGLRGSTSAVTDYQLTLAIYRQTTRAAGTGLTNKAFNNLDPRAVADPTSGFDVTTATTLGTTAPVLGAQLQEQSFNTKVGFDWPWEFMEELYCDQGTANGLAFVIIGNPLPASCVLTLTPEIEV